MRYCRMLMLTALLMVTAVSAGCKQGPWELWRSYSGRFIDQQGRVIDHQGGDRTTSEGQSYGLFFALVANDRETFGHLLSWTESNLAQGDLNTHMPGWLWGKRGDGSWGLIDANPASDADVWIAYSLVEAGRLWSEPRYTSLGRSMMTRIARTEVEDLPGFGPMLLPGPTGFRHSLGNSLSVWTINPSYMPLFIFERFSVIDPAGPWQKIALGVPRLLEQSNVRGWAMDWVEYIPGAGFTATILPTAKEGEMPVGSYDAIRVYLWAGLTEPTSPLRGELLNAIPAMGEYLGNHDAPPEKVGQFGVPQAQDGPVGFSSAVVPYLRAVKRDDQGVARQIIRVNSMKDAQSGLYGKEQAYYDQNLTLFSLGFAEGRYRIGQGGELKVGWTRS